MNKRVALIKIWHGGNCQASPPLGLLFIGTALKKNGFQPRIFHLSKKDALSELNNIIEFDPMLIGVSVITGDPTNKIHEFCTALKKKLSDIPIVFGGVHPTLEPIQCLKEDYVDYVILNEGEDSIVALANAIEDNRPCEQIDGFGYKVNNGVKINPFKKFGDIEKYSIDWSLIDVEKHLLYNYGGSKRVLCYVASRGCPHACGFCYNLSFNKRTWRGPSANKVIADITSVAKKYKIDTVLFYDDNFTANTKWALQVLRGLKENGIRGSHIETRVDYITEDFLRELKDLGVKSLFLGVESGSDRILQLISKGFKLKDTENALNLLKKYSIPAKLSFIVGFPTEKLAEYRLTLKLIVKCLENYNVGFTIGFYLPYPGSTLFNLCVERGFEKPKRFMDWEILDRWGGGEYLILPWTDEMFLDSREIQKLHILIGKMYSLRNSKNLLGIAFYKLVKFRFLNSGVSLVKILDVFAKICKISVKTILRIFSWFKKLQYFYFAVKLKKLKKKGDNEYNLYLTKQFKRSVGHYCSDTDYADERKKYAINLLASKINLVGLDRALVMGCRDTTELDLLAEKGLKDLIGIDLFCSDKRIKIMDIHELKFADNYFDLICCSHVLEHAYDYKKVISEMVRVLKNSGTIFMEVPINYQMGTVDLHNFEDYKSLLSIFKNFTNIGDIYLNENIKAGMPGNFVSSDISRLIFRIRK